MLDQAIGMSCRMMRASFLRLLSLLLGDCFERLPFGLISAQDTFEGLAGVMGIDDDIVVYGKNVEEHDSNLTAMLNRTSWSQIES